MSAINRFLKCGALLALLLIPQNIQGYYVCRPCCNVLKYGEWGSIDYLFGWRKPRFYPPLVTTNPTLPPVLGAPGTTILFGDTTLGGAPKSGIQGDLGVWISRCLGVGIGAYALADVKSQFSINGNAAGLPILGQPFFNTATGLEDAALLSFPTLAFNGGINIEAVNRLWGGDLYLRYRLGEKCGIRLDALGGFLYSSIVDDFNSSSTTTTALLETLSVTDEFKCRNDYYAGVIGLGADWRACKLSFVVNGKVGFGSMQKDIKIDGTTTTTLAGVTTVVPFGLLAEPSNSGVHKNATFEVATIANAKLRIQIFRQVWASVGGFYMYWPKVALAGNQIDLNINPTQVPGPTVGAPSPIFRENPTSFWVSGITAGLNCCY